MKILYFNNAAYGGLAQYAHYQANALVEAGCEVDFLCPENFPDFNDTKYNRINELSRQRRRSAWSKPARLLRFFLEITSDIKSLVARAENMTPGPILFGSYMEYFAPFWVPSLKRLNKKGFVFGSVLHDPIRDARVGPRWWHNHSVKLAYSFIDILFLHQNFQRPSSEIPPALPQIVIPHGPYPITTSPIDPREARRKLNLPTDKIVLLSFGHIRDNKNLDLAISCLADNPDIHIVVAGEALNDSQKSHDHYRNTAETMGVGDQVTWFPEYVADDQVSLLFSGSDGVLLTYSRDFHSASGVLNLAAAFEKPCIASAGSGPLEEMVKNYSLGLWVSPDNKNALCGAMKRFKDMEFNSDWSGYRRENRWELNAQATIGAFNNFSKKQ